MLMDRSDKSSSGEALLGYTPLFLRKPPSSSRELHLRIILLGQHHAHQGRYSHALPTPHAFIDLQKLGLWCNVLRYCFRCVNRNRYHHSLSSRTGELGLHRNGRRKMHQFSDNYNNASRFSCIGGFTGAGFADANIVEEPNAKYEEGPSHGEPLPRRCVSTPITSVTLCIRLTFTS